MHTFSNSLQHHAFLAYAFNNVDDAIFLVDENARFVMVNEKACRSLGYSQEELLTLRVFDIDPDFTQQDWEYFKNGIHAGTLSITIETHHKTKDGRIFPVEVNANYIVYEGKSYSMSLVRDISARKDAEKQLALLNYAIDHVGESAWLIDENAQFHYNNAEALRAIGYTREELLKLGVPDIDPDYQLDVWPTHWQDLKENGSLLFESRHQRKDGHIFPVEINANYFEFDGKAYNLALIRDISERKQAQEALQRSEKMLTEAQRIAKIGSWHVDFSNNTLTWSEETHRIWETEKSKFSAMLAASYDKLHPEDREKVINAYNTSVENKTLYQVEHRLVFPDGRIKYIAERGEPILDDDGNILHFIGTAMDITEQQHIKNTLEFIAQRGWKENSELFLHALAQYLAQIFGVEYVIIDKLASSTTQAETVALYAKGDIVPNIIYELKGTPCDGVANGKLCLHPKNVQQLFPDDLILVELQAESYAGLPLWNTKGEVIGLIAVLDTKPMHEVSFITSILQLVATSVAAELERQRSEQVLLDSRHFLKQIINTLADPVFVKDREHRWLVVNQAFCEFMGLSREELHGKTDYDFFPDNQADVFWNQDENVFEFGEENINEEEITTKDGIARIILTKKTCYTDSNGQKFLVGIITDITERKHAERQLEYQASYDLLTGLPNRRMFNHRLHIEILKAKRQDIRIALLFIDLDNFKEINDILGHKTGDYLLIDAAHRIQNCVRQTDTVARLGGDEFVVILPEAGLIPPLERIAGQLLTHLQNLFTLQNTLFIFLAVLALRYIHKMQKMSIHSWDAPTKRCMQQKKSAEIAFISSLAVCKNKHMNV